MLPPAAAAPARRELGALARRQISFIEAGDPALAPALLTGCVDWEHPMAEREEQTWPPGDQAPLGDEPAHRGHHHHVVPTSHPMRRTAGVLRGRKEAGTFYADAVLACEL